MAVMTVAMEMEGMQGTHETFVVETTGIRVRSRESPLWLPGP